MGMAVDGAGNIFIADTENHRIRKVTASTGIITTVAGNGTSGYSGDGGAATSAELNAPYAVALDTAGNIYIADTQNYRIRKITASTGVISTVAGNGIQGYSGDGGTATSAEFGYPSGLALDTAGNIYIVDNSNQRVRKVTASTGVISTVAGNGTAGYSGDGGAATSAELAWPADLALDTAGNIYIADGGNNRVRKVTVSTGIISTVAGNGTGGYSGDGGSATSAELNNPSGLILDTAGNIYISDLYNLRIREVTASTGVIATVAGNGSSGYSGEGGAATSASISPDRVALDYAGNLYISGSSSDDRIHIVGAMQQLADFDQITTSWILCTGPSCAGGTGNPTSTMQTFGNSSPSLDGSSMLLQESGPASSNNGWYRNTGADNNATGLTLDLQFNVPSNTDIQALEFDQFQYIQAPHGGVTSNTRLFFGTECVKSGTWQVWDSSTPAWVNTGVACSYIVSSTAFNHLVIKVHRVFGDTSCAGGRPCMYYDSITLNGSVVVSNIKTNSGALPAGWGETTGFMIQMDTNSACGSACTINEYIDKGVFSY